jgi:S-formylglutathione hydrolase FrmB
MGTTFELGGQRAVFHRCDEFAYGFFHTYDRLALGGDNHAEPHKVHVLLPNDYEDNQHKRWPVLYFNDGDTAFWPGGGFHKTWSIASILGGMVASGEVEPVIVVAVVPNDREHEYTDTEWAPGRSFGGLDHYAQLMADHIKPWFDTHYRTVPDARRTTVAGSSHGGLASFYIAATRPQSFGLCLSFSPSLWVGQSYWRLGLSSASAGMVDLNLHPTTLIDDHAVMATLASAGEHQRPKIFFGVGLRRGGGFHNACVEHWATECTRAAVATLTDDAKGVGYREGVDLFVHKDPEGEHTEETWQRWLPYVLRLYYGAR